VSLLLQLLLLLMLKVLLPLRCCSCSCSCSFFSAARFFTSGRSPSHACVQREGAGATSERTQQAAAAAHS
jgi:hypothetical protein